METGGEASVFQAESFAAASFAAESWAGIGTEPEPPVILPGPGMPAPAREPRQRKPFTLQRLCVLAVGAGLIK
jgi:hypothetical protein